MMKIDNVQEVTSANFSIYRSLRDKEREIYG